MNKADPPEPRRVIMPLALGYAQPTPHRGVKLIEHEDGISITFPRNPIFAAGSTVLEFAEGGLLGCLLPIISPILLIASVWWLFTSDFGAIPLLTTALAGFALFGSVYLFFNHHRGPILSIRAGRITYWTPRPRIEGSDTRSCDVNEVFDISDGGDGPIIRLKSGNELLGGYDAIRIPGFRRLPQETKTWITETLRSAVGLRPSSDD